MFKVLLGVFLAVSSVSGVFANGLFIPPGARASALGNAGVAGTIDAGAIYYNPAELAELKGSEVQIEPSYSVGALKSSNSMKNVTPPQTPDVDNSEFVFPAYYNLLGAFEPAKYTAKQVDINSFLPFTAGYTKINDVTVALGAYVAGGGVGKFDSTALDIAAGADLIHAAMDSSFGFVIYNISAGKEIAPDVNLGLGVNVVTMQSKAVLDKQYTRTANSVLPAGFGSYSAHFENSAAGSGLEGVVGVTYRPVERLKAGLIFRSGSTIALKGTAKYSQTGLGPLGTALSVVTGNPLYAASFADASLRSDYDQRYAYPMTAAIGAEYQATGKLGLLLEVDRNNYSVLKNEVTYKSPVSGVFDNVNASLKWNDTYQLHAGAEYRVDEKLQLRGGFMTDPLAFTREKASLTNTNEFNILVFSVGAGYSFEKVHLDFAYLRAISDKFDNLGRSFEYASDMFQVGIKYRI